MSVSPPKPAVCSDHRAVAYKYSQNFGVSDEMKDAFAYDGAVVVKGILDKEELDLVEKSLKSNPKLQEESVIQLADGEGRVSKILVWNHPGNDVTGMVGRCNRIVDISEKLLGGEVYHYHTKLMMKNPQTGGKFLWHQDYGYWYQNGNLRPDMLTAFIAIDKCVKENGCLQVILGSHRCGRLNHTKVAEQMMADKDRVTEILKHFPKVYVELEPGDCLFFHSNVLHTSGPNNSDIRRWAFLTCYNRADNDPVYKHHHPNYTPLIKVPDDAIRKCDILSDIEGKDYVEPSWKPKT